jgi:hypothetical protein
MIAGRHDYREKRTLNRPFQAFAVLVVLLTGAMLAVSSPDRCTTTVAPAATVCPCEDSHGTAPIQRRLGGVFVFVLPTAESECANVVSHLSLPNGLYGRRAGASVTDAVAVSGSVHSKLPTARVEFADGSQVAPLGDCGETVGVPWSELLPLGHHESPHGRTNVSMEETLDIIHSFTPRSSNPRMRPVSILWQRSRMPESSIEWTQPLTDALRLVRMAGRYGNARTLLLGLRNRLARELQQSGAVRVWPLSLVVAPSVACPAVEWTDYSALVDEIANHAKPTASQAIEPGSAGPPPSVRSHGWLLHFTASSLYELGVALQSAAIRLQQVGSESVAREASDLAR